MSKEEECRGSFTVEAALLMPFLLLVVMGIIYFSFYLHDRCVLQVFAERGAVYLTNALDEGTIGERIVTETEKTKIISQIATLAKKQLFLGKEVTGVWENTIVGVQVRLTSRYTVPFAMVGGWMQDAKLEVATRRDYHDPVDSVRLGNVIYRQIKQLSKKQK